jgi:hypothetical protein
MNRAPRLTAVLIVLAVLTLSLAAPRVRAAELSTGQTVYVPCYSRIYHGIKGLPINLTITLSVRNADPSRALTLKSVDYYDTSGRLLTHLLGKPLLLGPLATVEYQVGEADQKGGSGAKFMVRWSAGEPVEPLCVEAVMIGSSGQQGISFSSPGRPLNEPPMR